MTPTFYSPTPGALVKLGTPASGSRWVQLDGPRTDTGILELWSGSLIETKADGEMPAYARIRESDDRILEIRIITA